MTALSSYSTGTISVSADATTVTGVGPLWLTSGNAKPGDLFQSGHFCVFITDVPTETSLTITPWPGSAISGASYSIWKVSQQRIVGATYAQAVDNLVTALDTTGFFVFVNVNLTEPDPSLGDDGQYAFQPTTGKTWAKVAGVWTYLGIYKGFQLLGAWSGTTAYAAGDVVTLSGSSYVCVLNHTNHAPPNTTYWQLLASVGSTGAAAWTAPAAWLTATAYVAGPPASVVTQGGETYVCLTSHTSGTFATDLAAAKWIKVATKGADAPTYGGTSTTSLAIGTGSKAFTTQAGLAYTNGARVRASSAANTANWMEGLATYSGTTLTIAVDKTGGSGTFADWNFNVVGQPGAGDLTAANNLSDLASAATAATNLGVVRYGGSQSLTSPQQVQARANIGAAASITSITGSLSADVALNNTSNYFDGPSVAQGTSGTWFVSATVTVVDTAAAAGFLAKLWDGTTVVAAAADFTAAASQDASITLSGVITNPVGNLRVSVRDYSSTSGKIEANRTNQGNRDSTITAIRIA